MTTAQKAVKYLAIALAFLLIFGILSAIVTAIGGVVSLLDAVISDDEPLGEMTEIYAGNEIASLNIDIKAAKLTIEKGEAFHVSTNNGEITAKKNGDTLVLKESNHKWFYGENNFEMIITIPEGFAFHSVEIDIGAGAIEIDSLTADTIEIDIGAAELTASYLCAKKAIDADLGTGNFEISSGYLASPDFDLGVGKTKISAFITGDGEFDCGIGGLELIICGAPADYKIKASCGIGEFTVGGQKISDNDVIGNGENVLRISGGIGEVEVSFLQESDA